MTFSSGLMHGFCFHIHKSVFFSHPSQKYTFVSKAFFIQIILTLLNCLSWHKHFAHGQAHKALNVNQYPSTKIKSEFSGIH